MGQKINPIGFRLAVRRDWYSQWFARKRDYADQLLLDYHLRKHIERKFAQAMIAKIEIVRQEKTMITVYCAKPGLVIGKKGEDIDVLRMEVRQMSGSTEVEVDIKEIRQPESNATLIARNIATQLEKRVMFRRAMRRALQNAERVGVKGIKIMCKGRLNGAEIARFERYHRGRVPLHTLRADVQYGFCEAKTSMGVVGVKVWIFLGETPARVKYNRAQADEALSRPVAFGGSPGEPAEAAGDEAQASELTEEASKKEAKARTRRRYSRDDVDSKVQDFDAGDFPEEDLDDLEDDDARA